MPPVYPETTHGQEPLRFFFFIRAQGGHANDGDELRAEIRCEDPSPILEAIKRVAPKGVGCSFSEGVLTLCIAGGNGDAYSVSEADEELARQVEKVLGPYREQTFVPSVLGPGYWQSRMEWWAQVRASANRTSASVAPSAPAPVDRALPELPSPRSGTPLPSKSMIKVHGGQRLYDGGEEPWQADFQIALENGEWLSLSRLGSDAPRLAELERLVSESDFSRIVEECRLQDASSLGFKGSQNLLSYFRIVQSKYLVVFSYGELQPARYVLEIEGVFQDWASLS
jgi:hypothetical protein